MLHIFAIVYKTLLFFNIWGSHELWQEKKNYEKIKSFKIQYEYSTLQNKYWTIMNQLLVIPLFTQMNGLTLKAFKWLMLRLHIISIKWEALQRQLRRQRKLKECKPFIE